MKSPFPLAFAALWLAAPAAAETGNWMRCVVHHEPEEGRLATCTGRVSPRHPPWTFVLRGEPPNHVAQIEIYETGRETPRQVLANLNLRPPLVQGNGIVPGRVAFVLQDVNFDRLSDLRLAIGPPDADGTAFRWFLFDTDKGEFVATDTLDILRDPIVTPRRRLIQGAFRDERGRSGHIAFKWQGSELVPVGAIAREQSDGRCIAIHYVVRDGKFERRRETECRASESIEVE
jgi:hypothetical protein